jgi:hypothetical protein
LRWLERCGDRSAWRLREGFVLPTFRSEFLLYSRNGPLSFPMLNSSCKEVRLPITPNNLFKPPQCRARRTRGHNRNWLIYSHSPRSLLKMHSSQIWWWAGRRLDATKSSSSVGQCEQLEQKCQILVPIFLRYSDAISRTSWNGLRAYATDRDRRCPELMTRRTRGLESIGERPWGKNREK